MLPTYIVAAYKTSRTIYRNAFILRRTNYIGAFYDIQIIAVYFTTYKLPAPTIWVLRIYIYIDSVVLGFREYALQVITFTTCCTLYYSTYSLYFIQNKNE